MSEQIEKDPMELTDNHFEQDAIDSEESFIKELSGGNSFTEGITQQKEIEKSFEEKQEDEEIEKDGFKFDDAIAQEEKAELDELNKKLGTDYKDLSDLKKAFKKEDSVNLDKEIEQDRNLIDYFRNVLDTRQYNDKRIVLEDKKLTYQQEGKDISDPEILEEIELEIETLESSGALSYAAKSIRDTVRRALEGKEAKVSQHDQSKELTQKEKETARTESIQNSINEIYKAGPFMGITPTKEDMIDIYKEVSKNKHIEHLNSNPKDAIEFALFKRYKPELVKSLGRPSYKDGVKNTLETIGLTGSKQTVRTGQQDQSGNEGDKSYFEKFIQ